MNGQMVVPVFYHVDPSDVRKQTGSFRDAFSKHEKQQLKKTPEKVQKWRHALTEASNLSGWASKEIRSEAHLLDVVVKDILKKVENITASTYPNGLVGLNSQIEKIKSLLCLGRLDFKIVGIWGMGGIGKTTIAGVIFNQISKEFESKCFLANVREESEKGGGLLHLRDQVLSEVFEENLRIRTPNLPEYVRERLRRTKVLIVLDDVNKVGQLEYLIGGLERFGPGSRIIVTTRDRRVLDNFGVGNIYKVNGLKYREALELFCNCAFKENHCPEDLLVHSKRILDYANGNPLAVRVLGSFLRQKSKLDWESALDNLKRISDPDIYDVLKISYNEIKAEEKSLFLDIACFFNGQDKDSVLKMIGDSSFAHYGLNVLVDKSLVTVSRGNQLQMHDLLQEMGREIVRQESIEQPGKRSRLWYYEDVYNVLKKTKGTDAIEGIFLDLSKIKVLHLGPRAFANMSNLRLLKLYMPEHDGIPIMSSKVYLDQGLEYLPEELRYLHWYEYPLKSLPSDFEPENLVALNLPYSKVKQIWDGKKDASKLNYIDLHHSNKLIRIPEPSEIPNLEKINLWNCTKFAYISQYIQNFSNLGTLCLSGCESLRCFPSNIHFASPIKIDFSFCVNLSEFPQILGNIKELNLRKTAIGEVPLSIERLTSLEGLDVSHCTRLKRLSTSICKLKSLCRLELQHCPELESFPEILEEMECLEYINLSWTPIKELPSSIERLGRLTALVVWNCSKLDSLPESFGNLKSLKDLNAIGSAISQLPSSAADLNEFKSVAFSGCKNLVLPLLLPVLSSVRSLDLRDCGITEIPKEVGSLSSMEVLDLSGNKFESLPASVKQLSQLKCLYLRNCNMLQSIPELPLRLERLDARNCKRLRSLPELPSCLLRVHLFSNCLKLNNRARNKILRDLQLRVWQTAVSQRPYYDMEFFTPLESSIIVPGNKIPEWFINQRSGSSITIQLPQRCNKDFVGFALCAVIVFEKDPEASSAQYFQVVCRYRLEKKLVNHDCWLVMYDTVDSDHLMLGFDPCWSIGLPDGDHHTAVKLEFALYYLDHDGSRLEVDHKSKRYKLKCCGVTPVYANPVRTKPKTPKFAATSEVDCTRFTKFDKACTGGTFGSVGRYDEKQLESSSMRICRDQINVPSFLISYFLLFAFLLFISSLKPQWKL
ncbi:Disease resistance-like protein DSC1 [Citrus sinensis]|nr:Disease resistance-like protein DSC1 [Citrus sinensis]